jgi:hypothetical protein
MGINESHKMGRWANQEQERIKNTHSDTHKHTPTQQQKGKIYHIPLNFNTEC